MFGWTRDKVSTKRGFCGFCRSFIIVMFPFVLMWPFLDVSCPIILILPEWVQYQLVEYHVRPLSQEDKTLSADGPDLKQVITLHGHYSEQDVLKVVKEYPYSSVLIKSFLTKDKAAELFVKFKDMTASKNYSLLNDSINVDGRMGGLFSTGLHAEGDPWDDYKNSGRRRLVQSDLSGILNGTAKDIYGAFVPVGEGGMHTLLNWTSRKLTPDTSFFAFFSQRFVSTPLHANWPANTLSLQLAGRKEWIIIDPFDMKASLKEQRISLHSAGAGGVYYPNLKLDKGLQGRCQVAIVEPGDLLYFPPYAAHTVLSDEGLNVMTALRLHDPLKAAKIHPWKTLQAISIHGSKGAYNRIKYALGLNKYAHHYDISKKDPVSAGVPLKSWSPTYDDLHLKGILEKLAPTK